MVKLQRRLGRQLFLNGTFSTLLMSSVLWTLGQSLKFITNSHLSLTKC